MTEKDSRQDQKQFKYESPSKTCIETPIKSAFKNSKYKIGVFLEKMNELNKMKEKIKGIDLESKKGEDYENGSNNGL